MFNPTCLFKTALLLGPLEYGFHCFRDISWQYQSSEFLPCEKFYSTLYWFQAFPHCILLNFLQTLVPFKVGPQQYVCPLCAKVSRTQGRSQAHIMTHTGAKPFTCEDCDFACNDKGNLKRHMRLKHSKGTFKSEDLNL